MNSTNREHEANLFFNVSCTKDEAVGMLLGWMQGFTRPKEIKRNDYLGIPEDQLQFLQSLDGPLVDYLSDLRYAAYEDFRVLYQGASTVEELDIQEAVIDRINAIAEKAWGYLMDIADEIAKGELSALRIDQEASARSGTPHYTLRSIDAWANEKYKTSIFSASHSTHDDDRERRLEAINNSEPEKGRGLSKTVANNLYITFGLLTELFSETGTAYKSNGKLNIKGIAERIEELGRKHNKGDPLYGQSAETIKSVIEEAQKRKASALPAA